MLSKSPTKLLKKGKTKYLVTEPPPPLECLWAQPGRKCWCSVPLSQCFYQAKIISRDDSANKVTVSYDLNEAELSSYKILIFSKLLECNEDAGDSGPEGYEDMVNMNCLNEAELLYNLKFRYKQDLIYSYIGPTLLFVNPYKPVPMTYSESILESYHKLVFNEVWNSREKPHVYAVAAKATHKLLQQGKNQAIVISGESGAGKTENTKYALKFLTYLSSKAQGLNPKGGSQVSIEEKIMSSNPILEAFGNAKTVRNDNSSRFGKYMRIKFNKETKQIQGVEIKNYLLEKSRVTNQTKEERNYHIFYQLLRSKDPSRLSSLGLVNENGSMMQIEEFEYLKNSDKEDIYSDRELYKSVCESFENMSFSEKEKDAIWGCVGAILLLGNLEFDETNYKINEGIKPCDIINEGFLDIICKLLGTDKPSLMKSLLFSRKEIQRQIIETSISKNECQTLRNSLSKRLYDKLFTWLTKRINMQKEEQGYITIGLLDIFGFEKFTVNSLEQLCINYTNEKLHQLYIEYVFKSEKAELMEQGLTQQANNLIIPKDNIEVITLIEKVFNPIDESAANNKFAMSNLTDAKSLTKLVQEHGKNPLFKTNSKKPDLFTILHTADEVEYMITGFKSKNQDFFPKDFEDVLLATKSDEFRNIYLNITTNEKQKNNGNANDSKFTLLQKFKLEMKELMDVLIQCEVHFIRCLKPNVKKSKDYFHGEYVLQQINYLGVLESIKIRKEGFPFRKDFKRFLLDYSSLSINSKLISKVNATNDKDEWRKMTWVLMRNIILNEKDFYQKILYGRNKINLKQDLATQLDKLLLDKNRKKLVAARVMIKQYRIYALKKIWKENLELMRQSFLMISKMYKGHYWRKKFIIKKKRAIIVQSFVRMRVQKRIFTMKKKAMKLLNRTFMKNRKKMLIDKLVLNNIFFKTWKKIDERITKRGFLKRFYKQVQLKNAFLAEKKAKEQLHALKLMNKFLDTKKLMLLMSRMRKEIVIYKRFKKACIRLKSFRIGFMIHAFMLVKMAAAQSTKQIISKIYKEKENINQANNKKQDIQNKNIIKIQGFYRKKMAKSHLNRIILRKTQLKNHGFGENSVLTRIARLIHWKQMKKSFKILTNAFENSLKVDDSQEETKILSINELNTRTFGKLNLQNLKKLVIPQKINKPDDEKKINKTSKLYDRLFLSKNEPEFEGAPLSKDASSTPELPEAELKSLGAKRTSIWDWLKKDEKAENKPDDENEKKKLKKIKTVMKNFKDEKAENKQYTCVNDIVKEGFAGGNRIKEEIFQILHDYLSDTKHPEKYVRLLSIVVNCFKITEKFYYWFLKKLYDIYSKHQNADNSLYSYCSKAVQRSWEKPQKNASPSKEELLNIWHMKQYRIMIKINSSLCFCYFIENYYTVKELLEIVIKNIELEDIGKYLGLYLDFQGKDYFLSTEKVVLDEINRLRVETGGDVIPDIYLKIKLFNIKLLEDYDYLILRYIALLDDYLKGKFECNIEDVYDLASYAFFINKGKYTGEEIMVPSDICPNNHIIPEKLEEMIKIIIKKYREKSDFGVSRKAAMLKFLNILMKFEKIATFECNYGVIKVDKDGKIVSEELYYNATLTVKEKNIVIIREKELKQFIESFSYRKIKLYDEMNEGKQFIFRIVSNYDEIYVIENNRSAEIKGLVEGYVELF